VRKSFAWHFPLLSLAVRRAPIVALGLGLLAIWALIAGAQQLSYSSLLVAVGLLGFWLDRKWFEVWPLPPVLWFSVVCIFAGGIGPILLGVAEVDYQLGSLAQMQLGVLVGHVCFFVSYYFLRPSAENCPSIHDLIQSDIAIRRALVGACYLFLGFGVSETVVGAISGSTDRGMFGEQAAFEVLGYWTYFAAFNRLTILSFLLAPLAWRYGNIFGRFVIIFAAGFIFLMSAAGGSRSWLFTPLILALVGYICFSEKQRVRAEWIVVALVPFVVFAFVFLDHYRNTDTFQRESLSNPLNKFGAISEAKIRAADSADSQLYLIGERLVGNVDPLIYAMTPSVIPHAGFEGIDGLLWLYVPTFMYPNRPRMVDASVIGERYLQAALVRTSIGSSLAGDWYRRFGWAGIAFGMAVVGCIIALSLRAVIWALRNFPFWGLAVVFVVSTLATKDANMTVSTATWLFLYDFPKYYVVIVLFFISGRFVAPMFSSGSLQKPVLRSRTYSAPSLSLPKSKLAAPRL
jgi:hypothetical protein